MVKAGRGEKKALRWEEKRKRQKEREGKRGTCFAKIAGWGVTGKAEWCCIGWDWTRMHRKGGNDNASGRGGVMDLGVNGIWE